MEQILWLLLSYQLPAEPSKIRVYVWRKLKDIGTTYYRPGIAMLPKNPKSLAEFTKLGDKIREMQGAATLAELRFLTKKDDQNAVAEFRKQSRSEYKKIINEISQLYYKKPTTKEEAQLTAQRELKLESKLRKIRARDYFMSSKEPEVKGPFSNLLKDMSSATDNLSKHVRSIINEF